MAAVPVDEPQAPEVEPEANRRWDTELRTLNQIIKLFGELEPDAQPRVMAYIYSRFQGPVDTTIRGCDAKYSQRQG